MGRTRGAPEIARRIFLGGTAATVRRAVSMSVLGAWPWWCAHAQSDTRTRRIGYLSLRASAGPLDKVFFDALRALGYAEGQNLAVDYRWAADDEAALPNLAAELVRGDVEVIVTSVTPAVSAAKQATRTIPIVMQVAADPVGSGLVQSLASPGGNVTGMTLLSNELTPKRLQLMKELIPNFKRVGLMAIDNRFATPLLVKALRAAATDLGIDSVVQLVRTDEDVARGFTAIARAGANGVLLQAAPFISMRMPRMAEVAIAHRLPTICETANYVAAGGLAAYGPETAHLFVRAASIVDRVLRGASPASLPVEQPTKFELALNLKTAKALGLAIPPSVLLRADEVIQ